MLKRLGAYLTEIGDFAKALGLLEKAAAAGTSAKPSADDVALWMEMGRLYYLTEQHAKAAGHFERVLEALDRPDQFGLKATAKKTLLAQPGPAYAMMGESFLLAGQFPKAAATFEKGNKAAPNKGLLGYQLAKVDFKTGKAEAALQKLQAYFDAKLVTEEALPYQLLADVLKSLKKESELVARLEKLRAADPENAWLGYFLADKYFEAQRFDQAEKLYRDLVAKRPAVIGYRNLAQIYRKGKRYDDLVKLLGEAAGKLGSLDAVAPKGHTLAEDSELVRGVVEAARKQLKSDPKALSHQTRLAVALLAADAKQWDTAGEFFDLAIKSQPDQAAKLMLTWGLGLLLKEEHGRAVKVFQRAIDQKALPAEDPTLLFYLAGALEMAGQTEPALAAARKAAELAKNRAAGPKSSGKGKDVKEAKEELPRYLARAAWVLYHAKRYDEAIKGYREVLEKYSKDYSSGEIRKAVREARLVLSNLAVLKSDLPKAEEWLEQVLDEFPDDPSALNDLGYLWADQGKHLDRALRMIRQALQQEPDNAAYRDSLGWVLFRKGQVREALPELEKAAALEPDPTVLEHLGDVYRAAGQNEKAKQSWRKAVEAYRKAKEEQKARKVEEKIKS
jgi:tetratricopeptide (TPR) repeat protein